MTNPQIDYYAILELSAKATPDEIKRQYRELARRFHPDVNHNADAPQKIKSINEAYHVLGDSDRRGTYDAERLLQADAAKRAPDSAQPNSQTSAGPPGGSGSRQSSTTANRAASSGPNSPYGYNGFGRVGNEAGRNRSQQAPGAGSTRQTRYTYPSARSTSSASRNAKATHGRVGQTVQSLVADAQMAYVMRRYNDAERLCRQVLALDRRQPIIHEMLGDIYARRGDNERATTAYAYAVQFNPRNQNAQIKLERLAGVDMTARHGPTLSRQAQTPVIERILNGPDRDRFIGVTGLALITIITGVIIAFSLNPGYNSALMLGALSINLLLALLVTGLASGILMAFYGGMRPVSTELAVRSHPRSAVNLSTVLSFSAVIWFYLSLLIYMFVAVTRNRSMSVLRAYGVSLVLSLAFALLYQSPTVPLSGIEAGAFAGNILFPTLLLGWRLGDRLRLSGR